MNSAQQGTRALSQAVRALTTLADQAAAQDFLAQAMHILRALVPFDSAWWGEVSAGLDADGPRNWLHGSMGLSQSFVQEWTELAALDGFAQRSIAQLGVVVHARDVLHEHPDDPQLAAFAVRHGLHHCMALTAELPHSGLLFFVSVYRPPTRSDFTADDTLLFGEFVAHLLLHWQLLLKRVDSAPAQRPWDRFALAEPSGLLLFAGLRIGQAMGAACPGWAGTRLPLAVQQALARAPCSIQVGGGTGPGAGKACRLQLDPCGSLVAIRMASDARPPPLSPRELSAAMLYAQGQSHKDIAAALGLTPATVRTYLRTAYAALGVSNKLALVAALRQA